MYEYQRLYTTIRTMFVRFAVMSIMRYIWYDGCRIRIIWGHTINHDVYPRYIFACIVLVILIVCLPDRTTYFIKKIVYQVQNKKSSMNQTVWYTWYIIYTKYTVGGEALHTGGDITYHAPLVDASGISAVRTYNIYLNLSLLSQNETDTYPR